MSKPFSLRRVWADLQTAAFDIGARRKLARLRDAYAGKTIFLVGAGPSLRTMDLAPLQADGRIFMTVNNGHRLFAGADIPMHAVSDINCYETYAADIEAARVGVRFYRSRFRTTAAFNQWGDSGRIVFVPYRRGGVLKRAFQPHADRGIGNDSTVLVFAAQLAFHLGFSNVYVMGCDLDYSADQKYAYNMNATDAGHEATALVQYRRLAMEQANAEFAAVRDAFERAGRQIANCGRGGKLETLPRVPYETALSETRAQR